MNTKMYEKKMLKLSVVPYACRRLKQDCTLGQFMICKSRPPVSSSKTHSQETKKKKMLAT